MTLNEIIYKIGTNIWQIDERPTKKFIWQLKRDLSIN